MLTSHQIDACLALIIGPFGKARLTSSEFLAQVPVAVSEGVLAPDFWHAAVEEKDADALVCALLVGFSFGFPSSIVNELCDLLGASWHRSHENLVEALDGFDGEVVADALVGATEYVPEYLAFDDSRALAIKAVWMLSKLKRDDALPRLLNLAEHPVERIRICALERLQSLS